MNIASAKEQVRDAVEAYLQTDEAGLPAITIAHQRPVFLVGAPGIGKTAIMEQVAQELGIGIVSYSMTHHTRQSALGLPRIEHREFDGMPYDASEYTMSEIVAAIYDYMERTGLRQGILFLDEVNCVSETLYPSMLQFLQFKTFGKHKVPEGWVVVCAGNPPEYNRSVHEFDVVTLDRLREIDVEPDYEAWKAYASAKGLHPAVTTFLEAKKGCFYKVESRPGGGKSFVTARGWEDLAQAISLYEAMGKAVDRDLIAQFLRDDEVADAFAVYYALFQKYRSDYQVAAILDGTVGNEVKERAREGAFDERLALIGLMLDGLSQDCAAALEQEAVAMQLRDALREAKEPLLAGGTVEAVLAPKVAAREADLARKQEAGTVAPDYVRRERLAIGLLRGFMAQCSLERALEGEGAFRTLEAAYKGEVAKLDPLVRHAGERIDHAFEFVDECFGTRELLVLMAELSTRKATTQYVAHYGSDQYYVHNEELQVDAARMGLAERASLLDELAGGIEQERPTSGGAGAEAEAAVGETTPLPPDADALRAHYAAKQFEYGFASICKMRLPASELKGKKVLDIGSRRGRGVYKISSMVGDEGRAIGVDWSAAYVEESRDGMDRAWHDSGLKGNNMEFHLAYPEDLISAGIGTATLDAVYVNNVMTLFCDQAQALREFARVLKPGGLLVMETVFADRPHDEAFTEQAREMGNSIQAARTREENLAWLAAAGFEEPSLQDSYEVAADQGFKPGATVAAVPGDQAAYEAVCLYARRS